MSCSAERRPRSLHLLICGADPRCPDPFGLAGAIGEPLDRVEIVGWSASPDDLDLATLQRVALLVDELAGLVRTTPVLVELDGPFEPAMQRHLAAAAERAADTILAVTIGGSRRTLRAARKAAHRSGAHLALVPELDPETLLVRR